MGTAINISRAARYIYPGSVLPCKPYSLIDLFDTNTVPYQMGSIGFDFIRLVEFEIEPGEVLQHALTRPETYYWGTEIDLDDLSDSPYLETIEELVETNRFVITCWGALIPLFEDDIVVPYPTVIELPLDMRLD